MKIDLRSVGIEVVYIVQKVGFFLTVMNPRWNELTYANGSRPSHVITVASSLIACMSAQFPVSCM
jgi:hypothetical protein